MTLRAPFSYFGGKSAIAAEIWKRLGTGADAPRHYIEPFAGSLAVLLARPGWRSGVRWVETINDLDGLLVNVWRALALKPAEVEAHAQWPVSELDLHARHAWLRGEREAITERLRGDPEWCDPRAAGWWLWGKKCAIGSDWESDRDLRSICRSRPPVQFDLSGLSERLACVRTVSGKWQRPVGSQSALRGSSNWNPVAIYLDPPYGEGTCYAVGENEGSTAAEVWAWAVDAAEQWPDLRVAVSGYEDGREVPDGWETLAWKTNGGYGNQGNGTGRANARRERVWFSPGCIKPDTVRQMELLT